MRTKLKKMDLNQFLEIIRNMDRRPFKPHRYLALMAIMDVIENRDNQNQFIYNDNFKNYFTYYFNMFRDLDDRNRPFKPFFHLKNAGQNVGGFWSLTPKPGKELNKLRSGFSERDLTEIVEYAELDQELFDLLSNEESGQESREIVRNEIKRCIEAGRHTDQ